MPQSVVSRQLANPFLAPDFSAGPQRASHTRRLDGWELLGPLFSSFERADGGAPACMTLPAPTARFTPAGQQLMPHQGQLVAAVAAGHRTFLLADEPGLGKTAMALLAAEAANAYPLLVVVPSVVKTNWAREAARWTPHRPATVVHGDGDTIDGFADIVVLNYEVLDRHRGWLGDFGFRGMVVDEAHFIKNKTSQRSQNVLALSSRIRSRTVRPLLMALTGTPLINDIEDFRAIWQFLGWIDESRPLGELADTLEDTGLTPADRGFYTAARQCVIDLGIVRRRKIDVAADIPARRIADLPVELDGPAGRSIRAAERDLARRMVARYESALANRSSGAGVEGIDYDLVRRVARSELKEAATAKSGENVFTMMRRIGQAKAELAADYTTQLARSTGKVVFFAKHIGVMDAAEKAFAQQGVRYASIRGDQTPTTRQANIDAFVNDPDVAVAVCSLTAAGVGLNLQIASNIVLAELSWTNAEQTQAIDRSHRIGQALPVTAWRIIAAQTIDTRIAELIDSKAGLAARSSTGPTRRSPRRPTCSLRRWPRCWPMHCGPLQDTRTPRAPKASLRPRTRACRSRNSADHPQPQIRPHRRSMMVAVAMAPPAHMVIRAVLASRRSSSCSAVVISRAPVAPTGCPRAIAPPLTLTLSSSGRTPQPRQRHGRERLVDLEQVDVRERHAAGREYPLGRRDRAVKVVVGLRPDEALRDDPGPRPQPECPRPGCLGQQHGGRAVGDLRGCPGRVHAVLDHRRKPGQASRLVSRRPSSFSPARRAPSPRDLPVEPALRPGGLAHFLGPEAERVGLRARQPALPGDPSRCDEWFGRSMSQLSGRGGPTPVPTFERSGTRDMTSTPQPMPTLIASAAMRPAIRWTACCAEPHWASRVRQPVCYGRPA